MRIYIKHFKIQNFLFFALEIYFPFGLSYPKRAILSHSGDWSKPVLSFFISCCKAESLCYKEWISLLLQKHWYIALCCEEFGTIDSLENVWDHLLVKIQYLFHPLSSELAFASYALNLFLSNTRMQCLINMKCKQLSIQNFTSIFDSVDEFGRLKVNQYIWHEEMG